MAGPTVRSIRFFRVVGIVTVAVVVAASLFGIATLGANWEENRAMQSSLDPFYAPPDPIPSELGTVIRAEPLDIEVEGGSAQRILYVSERPDGMRALDREQGNRKVTYLVDEAVDVLQQVDVDELPALMEQLPGPLP